MSDFVRRFPVGKRGLLVNVRNARLGADRPAIRSNGAPDRGALETDMAAAKKTGARKAAAKRTLIKPKGDARFVRRDAKGRIKESDDVGRSQKVDRRVKAKTAAKSGQGDKGDRKPATKRKRSG